MTLLENLQKTLEATFEAGKKKGFEEGFKRAVELMSISMETVGEAPEGLKDAYENERWAL